MYLSTVTRVSGLLLGAAAAFAWHAWPDRDTRRPARPVVDALESLSTPRALATLVSLLGHVPAMDANVLVATSRVGMRVEHPVEAGLPDAPVFELAEFVDGQCFH